MTNGFEMQVGSEKPLPGAIRDWFRGWQGRVALVFVVYVAAHLLMIALHVGGDRLKLVSDAMLVPTPIAAAVLLWTASRGRSFDPRTRRAWRLFAGAFLVYAVANACWFGYELVLGEPPVFPSPLLILYLGVYPLMLGALLSFSDKLETREEKLTFGLDGGIVLIGGVMGFWHFLFQPTLQEIRSEFLATVTVLIFPVCDTVLLFGIVALYLRSSRQRNRATLGFVVVSMLLFITADTLLLYQSALGTYQSGALPDAIWNLGYLVGVLCGRHQCWRNERGSDETGLAATASRRDHSAVAYIGVAFGYGVLLTLPDSSHRYLIYGVALLTAFVVVRQIVATRAVARTQEALRASDERFRLVTRATSDAIWDWNLGTNEVWWSDAIRTMFGYNDEETTRATEWWWERVHPDDRVVSERRLEEMMAGGDQTVAVSYHFRRADGSYAPVMDRVFIVRDERGRPYRMIGSMMDVTERVEAERAMAAARDAAIESTRLKSEFLASMSHEIRTPMNGVIGLTDLLLGTKVSPEQREYLRLVKLSATSLLTVINDILDFSRIEAKKVVLDRRPFNLRARLGDTMSVLAVQAHEKGLELAYRVSANVPDGVMGDAGRVQQVLTNLIGNAIKFTATGEVVVSVSTDWEREDAVCVRFSVADSGIGIAPEKRQVIFNAFTQSDSSTTRRYGGTGLGLAICSQLVELMGGRIWVESQLGQGSTFLFTVEFERVDVAPEPTVDCEALDGLRALVVDDNATTRAFLEELLGEWRIVPTSLGDGPSALAEFDRAEAEGHPYELVLLDAAMPGMNGFAVAERLEARGHGRRAVLLLPSAKLNDYVAEYGNLGVDAFVTKPVRPAELLDALLKVVEVRSDLPPGRFGPLKVLLAEDNRVNQVVARMLLLRRGHSVTVVGDGREALAALELERFDVVLMDVQMPGMNGFEATARVRERERERGATERLPIIAMTAYAMKGDEERCLAAGMDGYIAKPVQSNDLIGAVERIARTPV